MGGLLDEDTLEAAGEGASCLWTDTVTVTVTFGDGKSAGKSSRRRCHLSLLQLSCRWAAKNIESTTLNFHHQE